ncbi:hypothetical protein V6N12_017903 [Hibiscus sabdariffa]|uniref:Uncharacterized protein n=1 Tax=Hibiscus sabdariffa TaxID=183260 RepID=A0ABR2BM28_9ROSI
MVVSINEKGSSYDSKGSRWEQRGKSVMGKGKVEINRRSLQVNCGHEARVYLVSVHDGGASFMLTVVYANTCSSRHKHIWPQLEELNPGNSVPWSFGLGISRSTIHLVKRFSLSGPRSVCG